MTSRQFTKFSLLPNLIDIWYVIVPTKTLILCTLRKMNLITIRKITHVTKKNMQVFIGPVLEEVRFKSMKTIYHFICLLMESLKIFVLFL